MSEGNVLDTLKIVVDLDPTKFQQGQKKINEDFELTKTNAKKTADELETHGKQASLFFDEITSKALKLGTVLLGGIGLKDFIGNSVKTGAALGYTAQNAGVSAQALTKWKNVVRQLGFDAEEVAPSIQGLSQALTEIQLTGRDSAGLIPALQTLGITDLLDRTTGQLKTVDQLLPEIHKGLTALGDDGKPKFNAQQQYNLANRLGLSQGLVQALLQEGAAYDKSVDRADKASRITKEQIEDYKRLIGVVGQYQSDLESTGYEASTFLIGTFDVISKAAHSTSEAFGSAFDAIGDAFSALGKKFPVLNTIFKPLLRDVESIGNAVAGVKKHILALLGIGVGGTVGVAASTILLPFLGPLAPFVGGAIGAGVGWAAGHTADKTAASYSEPGPPGPPGKQGAPGAPGKPSSPVAPGALPERVFRTIQTLESGGRDNLPPTPTHNPKDPYAYGRNQITLETARARDKDVTIEKLKDPVYNDNMAKQIQAEYIKKYGDNTDAIAIAYHNGPGAADQFVAQGGSTANIKDFGSQSQKYLSDARAKLSGGAPTTNNTSTVHIGSMNIATNATDARGVASGMRDNLKTVMAAPNGQN